MKFATGPAIGRALAPPQSVIVAGKIIGTVTETENGINYRFHACLDLRNVAEIGGPIVTGTHALAQGHGATVEEAVADALASARHDTATYLAALSHLAELMEVA